MIAMRCDAMQVKARLLEMTMPREARWAQELPKYDETGQRYLS